MVEIYQVKLSIFNVVQCICKDSTELPGVRISYLIDFIGTKIHFQLTIFHYISFLVVICLFRVTHQVWSSPELAIFRFYLEIVSAFGALALDPTRGITTSRLIQCAIKHDYVWNANCMLAKQSLTYTIISTFFKTLSSLLYYIILYYIILYIHMYIYIYTDMKWLKVKPKIY